MTPLRAFIVDDDRDFARRPGMLLEIDVCAASRSAKAGWRDRIVRHSAPECSHRGSA